jgi:hypothetical protein
MRKEKFSEKNAFLWMLKVNSYDISSYIHEYLFRFDNEKYRLYKDDEFEMKKATHQLNETLANLAPDKVYSIDYTSAFWRVSVRSAGLSIQPF